MYQFMENARCVQAVKRKQEEDVKISGRQVGRGEVGGGGKYFPWERRRREGYDRVEKIIPPCEKKAGNSKLCHRIPDLS